jgi:serine/threonine-protein kinase
VSTRVDEAKSREGETLPGGLRLKKLIAVGGMAALYEASSEAHGTIAVKLLHRHMLDMPDMRERFLREGKLTMELRHPGVPAVYAMHPLADGTIAIAMELLRGETVQERIDRRGYLSAQEVLAIADGMLSVLAVAHERGIIHRDIKPENVFLTSRGELKLLDFGIARGKRDVGQVLTRAGATLGTPAFMSPEQAGGAWENIDARTDLWAVGATMYAALAGAAPHEKESLYDSLHAAVHLAAPKIASVVPGLRPAVAHVVDRALERDVEARWRDATAMRNAIHDAWLLVSGGTSMQKVWDHIAAEVVVTEPKVAAVQHHSLAATAPEMAVPSANARPLPGAPAPDVLAPVAPPKLAVVRNKPQRWVFYAAAASFFAFAIASAIVIALVS